MQHEKTKEVKVVQISCSDSDRHLPPSRKAIDTIKKSLEENGQINPISVYPVTHNSYRVIAGATRFRAASELGWQMIRVSVWSGSTIDFQLHELIENLDRRELSGAQRKEMRYKIKHLQKDRLANVQPCKGGRGNKGGASEAAREMGVSRRTVGRRQEDKGGHNEEDAQVSGTAQSTLPPSAAFATQKFSVSIPAGELYRLDEWCDGHNLSRSEAVRRFIRDRLNTDQPKPVLVHSA